MNLRSIIRDVIEDHEGPVHTADVAAKTVNLIPEGDRKEALIEALGHMVRDVIVQQRPSTPAPSGVTPSPKSWKRNAIRRAEEFRREELNARWSTKDGYKALGEFTYEDLTDLAQRCQDLGERNLARADHFRRIGEAVKAAGASRVADLPDTDLNDLWSA